MRRFSCLPSGPAPTWGPGAFGFGSPPPTYGWERQGLPGSWETRCAYALFSDPGRPNASGQYKALTWPPLASRRRLRAKGNFGAQSHGVGTGCLRFARWVTHARRKTRFWLLAKLYQAGLLTRRVSPKGFYDVLSTSFPPFPSFPGAGCVPFVFLCFPFHPRKAAGAIVNSGTPGGKDQGTMILELLARPLAAPRGALLRASAANSIDPW